MRNRVFARSLKAVLIDMAIERQRYEALSMHARELECRNRELESIAAIARGCACQPRDDQLANPTGAGIQSGCVARHSV